MSRGIFFDTARQGPHMCGLWLYGGCAPAGRPRRGQDPSLRTFGHGCFVGSGLDRSGTVRNRAITGRLRAGQTKKEGHRCPSRYGWIWRKSGIGQSGAKGCAGSLGVAVGGAVGHDRLNDQTGTGGLGVLGPGADPLAVTPAVGAEQANGSCRSESRADPGTSARTHSPPAARRPWRGSRSAKPV